MKNTYSVGQVNRYIKNMFTQDYLLQKIYVKGEVSNCKYHTSGHIYFSLKDETGTLNCVMFAGHRRGLAFAMKNGDKVIVGGSVDVYERDGRYQMYAKEITLEGAGTLYERYLALKQELEDMGMFAQEYKQPIPRFIRRLGVVTAPTGAAVQDIRNISYRRNPYLQIILYPALVQGAGAAESIVRGIEMLDVADVDVIIIGRGGGSIEDLWAFNEEIVARAIFECRTPIISAVGHETDFPIMKIYGYEKYISFDFGMLSKYQYYTGIIFQAYTYGTGEPMIKGGRYNGLMKHFGKPAASIGFALEVDNLLLALSSQKLISEKEEKPEVIKYEPQNRAEAIKEAQKLRSEGRCVALRLKKEAR